MNTTMNKLIKALSLFILMGLGVLCIIGGEIDDSPGLGGIGLILFGVSGWLMSKLLNKSRL